MRLHDTATKTLLTIPFVGGILFSIMAILGITYLGADQHKNDVVETTYRRNDGTTYTERRGAYTSGTILLVGIAVLIAFVKVTYAFVVSLIEMYPILSTAFIWVTTLGFAVSFMLRKEISNGLVGVDEKSGFGAIFWVLLLLSFAWPLTGGDFVGGDADLVVLYVPVTLFVFLGFMIPLVASFQNIYLSVKGGGAKTVFFAALMVTFCMIPFFLDQFLATSSFSVDEWITQKAAAAATGPIAIASITFLAARFALNKKNHAFLRFLASPFLLMAALLPLASAGVIAFYIFNYHYLENTGLPFTSALGAVVIDDGGAPAIILAITLSFIVTVLLCWYNVKCEPESKKKGVLCNGLVTFFFVPLMTFGLWVLFSGNVLLQELESENEKVNVFLSLRIDADQDLVNEDELAAWHSYVRNNENTPKLKLFLPDLDVPFEQGMLLSKGKHKVHYHHGDTSGIFILNVNKRRSGVMLVDEVLSLK